MLFRRKKRPTEGTGEGRPAEPGAPLEPRIEAAGGAPGAVSAAQFLTGDTQVDTRTLEVLLEAIARVSDARDRRDLESLLVDIVDRSIEVTGAERGLLLLRREDGELEARVARSRGGRPLEGDARFSTTVARKVLEEVHAYKAMVQSESEALDLARSVYDLKLRAVMCVPLAIPVGTEDVEASEPDPEAASAPPLGVLYVDSRAATRQFSQRDVDLFAALAQHISIALENTRLHLDSIEKVRLEQSLELASAIQRDLMPDIPRDLPGYDLHGWYRPAERTAGDFYDFVKTKDGRLAFSVGDVTGHGVGPALITAAAQASIRSYLRLLPSAGQVVTMLNQDLCERIDDGRFLTLFLCILDPDGGLEHLNAGHTPPLLWRKRTGEIEELTMNGPALGMIEDETYESGAPLSLEPGDVLLVYTDGLTEARDPRKPDVLFGEEGMRRVLAEGAAEGLSAHDLTERVVEAVLELAAGCREDDMTAVVLRRT